MRTIRKMNRRDRCCFLFNRMLRLTPVQGSEAWQSLTKEVGELSMFDRRSPRYNDLFQAIRNAVIKAKSK